VRREAIPSAVDLPKRTSSGYQAFLVQVMASSKNETSDIRLLALVWDFVLDLYPYFKKGNLIPILGTFTPISCSKEKIDLLLIPDV
jgi:hypothetical protein